MKKNIFNNAVALLTAGTLAFSPLSCGMANAAQQAGNAGSSISTSVNAENEAEGLQDEPVVGGWQVNQNAFSIKKNKDAKKALKKATKNLAGYSYTPIALLGTQVVAGTNYAILCRDKAVTPESAPVFEIVYVYEDLEGNAEILGVKELVGQQLAGGFTANAGKISLKKNPKVNAIFKKAFKGMVGVSYQPVAYLGRQVVAGTNYLAMYRTKATVLDPESQFVLVTAYKDLDGNVKLGDVETVVLGEMDSES